MDSNSSSFSITDSSDIRGIMDCAMEAFSRFEVFGPSWWSDAGVLPPVLMAAPGEPPLSRVALAPDGTILGHALWNLGAMELAGRRRPAAWLAPLSVRPSVQGKGIGSALMEDGISLLRGRGTEVLLILGHEKYYPRFGLLTLCHGRRAFRVSLPAPLREDPPGWRLRPVEVGDGPACLALWESLCGRAAGAIEPGPGLMPWLSRTKDVAAAILERGGRIAGHVRLDLRTGAGPEGALLRFLADGPEASGILLSRIAGWKGWEGGSAVIPLPVEAAAPLGFAAAESVEERWDGGMAMALQGSGPVNDVLEAVRAGTAPPLFVEWSPLFDF